MIRPLRDTPLPVSPEVQPVWELARMFPSQGCWDERDYLDLDVNWLIELVDGHLEFPPMPTDDHQGIVGFLYLLLIQGVRSRGGVVRLAPMRLRIRLDKMREPDLLVLLPQHQHYRGKKFWTGADLVVEVVSPDDPDRDLVTKRADYAELGVPEYWIVDPRDESLLVLTLDAGAYRETRHTRGEAAVSTLLPDLRVDVAAVFDAARV